MTTNTKQLDPESGRTREQQLRDIATAGNEDAAECASSDAFKEFPGNEPR